MSNDAALYSGHVQRLWLLLAAAFSLLVGQGASGNTPTAITDNARLVDLYEQDQADRKGFPNTSLSWREIVARDEARRIRTPLFLVTHSG